MYTCVLFVNGTVGKVFRYGLACTQNHYYNANICRGLILSESLPIPLAFRRATPISQTAWRVYRKVNIAIYGRINRENYI